MARDASPDTAPARVGSGEGTGGRGLGAISPQGMTIVAACLGFFAYWALALLLNPVSRLIIRRSAVMPFLGLRAGWVVLLLGFPVLGIGLFLAALGARSGSLARPGTGEGVRPRLMRTACRLLLIGLLSLGCWDAIRLHYRGLSYGAGVLLMAGTLLAFVFRGGAAQAPQPRSSRRKWIRPLVATAALAAEAFFLLVAIPLANQKAYVGLFAAGVLRPIARALLKPDFVGVDLPALARGEVDLRRAKLEGANLTGSSAPGADLRFARLEMSLIDRANIERADLRWANLSQVDMNYVRAAGADFSRATMIGTEAIGGGDFRGAVFRYSRLSYSKFIGVDARASDWSGADFHGQGFIFGSNLEGADFEEANLATLVLMKSDFAGACFRGADLRRAQLWHAVLRDADLEGADLRGAEVEAGQLEEALTLYQARLDEPLAAAIRKSRPELFEDPLIPTLRREAAALGTRARLSR